MLTPEKYKNLYNELLLRNIQLINNPFEYKYCHYLPESYKKIKSITPKSLWTTDLNIDNCIKLAQSFGKKSIIIKDYVKSEKHYWSDACFIPNVSDKNKLKNIIIKFLELRGKYLNGGVVFREYHNLELLEKHPKSGIPLGKEYRLFFLNHRLISFFNYWQESNYNFKKPNIIKFEGIAKTISSNFFTMDIAKEKNGNWIIIELGDEQVARLENKECVNSFYNEIKNQYLIN